MRINPRRPWARPLSTLAVAAVLTSFLLLPAAATVPEANTSTGTAVPAVPLPEPPVGPESPAVQEAPAVPVPGSISGRAFFDLDADGTGDPDDDGVPGVDVEPIVDGVTLAGTTVTGADGAYLFSGLEPDRFYRVIFILPDCCAATAQQSGR